MTGEEYKRRLKALGFSQARFAAYCGVARSTGEYWAKHGPHPAAAQLLRDLRWKRAWKDSAKDYRQYAHELESELDEWKIISRREP